jgi:hypothetical protein
MGILAYAVLAYTKIDESQLPHKVPGPSAVKDILSIVFGIIGALALLMITVSGLRYITSAGDPQKASNAKNGIIYALVGLIIALTAEAIIAFVLNRI